MQIRNVFYGTYREFHSGKPHYLIVIGLPSDTMPCIVLTAVTSQIEKARRRQEINGFPPETLVEVTPEEYPVLNMPSLVDCNYPVKCPRNLFEMDFGEFNRKDDMPAEIVKRIINGVMQSPLVSAEIKNMLKDYDTSHQA